jgi:hypothetical protein
MRSRNSASRSWVISCLTLRATSATSSCPESSRDTSSFPRRTSEIARSDCSRERASPLDIVAENAVTMTISNRISKQMVPTGRSVSASGPVTIGTKSMLWSAAAKPAHERPSTSIRA